MVAPMEDEEEEEEEGEEEKRVKAGEGSVFFKTCPLLDI